MISDRAPEQAKKADAILDAYLDGRFRGPKRDKRLRAVLEALPPKWCGCHFCTVRSKLPVPEPAEGGDDLVADRDEAVS